MIPRLLCQALLLALLAWNAWTGYGKIAGFFHRYSGEKQLTRAEMNPALSSLRAALRWLPQDPPSHLMLGRVVALGLANGLPLEGIDRAKPEQSLALGLAAVSSAASLSPVDAWTWFNLGELYSAHQAARSRLQRLLEAGRAAGAGEPTPDAGPAAAAGDPVYPEDRVVAAAALMAQELEPEFYFYHDYLARLYWDRGLERAAGSELRASFALMPQPQAHTLLEEGEIEAAPTDAILEGIDDAGKNPFIDRMLVLEARAQMFERLGRGPEAIGAFEALRKAGGEAYQAECDLRVAKLLQGMNQWQESLPLLEQVLEADPGGSRGTAALLYLGFAHSRLGDHKRSVTFLRRYLTRRPGSLRTMLTLAGGLEETGDPAEAGRIYRAMVERFPDEPSAYLALIRHLREQRRHAEALEYALRLRDLLPSDPTADRLIRQIEAERR